MRLPEPNNLQATWNSPVKDYEQLTDNALKFVFAETRAYFEETLKESEELTQRSAKMLFLVLPAISAVVAFCFTHRAELRPISTFRFMLVLATAGALVNCMCFLFKLMNAKFIHYRGNRPKEILRPEIFDFRSPLRIEKALMISEIEHYQVKIERMEVWNLERVIFYKKAIYSFNAAGLTGILTFPLSI